MTTSPVAKVFPGGFARQTLRGGQVVTLKILAQKNENDPERHEVELSGCGWFPATELEPLSPSQLIIAKGEKCPKFVFKKPDAEAPLGILAVRDERELTVDVGNGIMELRTHYLLSDEKYHPASNFDIVNGMFPMGSPSD